MLFRSGKSFVKREIVTDKHWEDHLNGVEPSLGIVPINENNRHHKELMKQVKEGKITIEEAD